MRKQVKITPVGGVEQDLSPDLLAEGLYIDGLNINVGYGTSNVGRVSNEKGNTLITSTNVEFVLGDVCLGAFSDRRNQDGYFFIYNTLPSLCKIVRYRPSETDPLQLIALGGDLAFTDTSYIHAKIVDDKYLAWVESRVKEDGTAVGNAPRMIDVSRTPYNVKRRWELHVPPVTGLAEGTVYQVRAISPVTGDVTDSVNVFFSSGYNGNEEQAFEDLVDAIDQFQDSVASPLNYDVSTCDCRIDITARNTTTIIEIEETTSGAGLFVNKNYESFSTRNIDLIKSPPNYEPFPCFVFDQSRKDNFVKGRSFQFRHRYKYRDGAYSAWGPVSIVPAAITRKGQIIDVYNAIDIDITAEELSTSIGRNAIAAVQVSFREGSDSVFKSIGEYDLECLGINSQVIRFYNNLLYSVVPTDGSGGSADTQVLKLFDSVPIISNAIELVTDEDGNVRIALGGNTEGYDSKCSTDMKVDVVMSTRVDSITIKGTVEIIKAGTQDDGTTNFRTSFGDDEHPLNGFVVYLAGTNLYGISNSFTDGDDGSFEINDVPPGRYIMRVASYRCRYNNDYGPDHNLNDPDLLWQTTSSPCVNIAGSVADTGRFYERELDLTGEPVGSIFDLDTEAGFGAVQIHDFKADDVIIDDSPAILEGYLRDNGGADASNSDRVGSIGVEQQEISFRVEWSGEDVGGTFVTEETIIAQCDHNGYFYSVSQTVGSDIIAFSRIFDFKFFGQDACSLIDPVPEIPTNLYRTGTNTRKGIADNTETLSSSMATVSSTCLLMNTDVDFATNSSTTISGSVESDTGIPVINSSVAVVGTGRSATVIPDGTFTVRVFLQSGLTDTRAIELIACNELDSTYQHVITPNPDSESVQFCVNNSGTVFDHGAIIFDGFVADSILKKKNLKSGGLYGTGIVYEDRANRKSLVIEGPQVRIPFHTEDGFYGRRDVRFTINGQAPTWATHYRIVMTKDSIYRRYLHWVSETVSYARIDNVGETPVITTFGAGDATHILIKINNNFTPPDVGVGSNPVAFFFKDDGYYEFDPEGGDRIRLILNPDGNVYGDGAQLFDKEIAGVFVDAMDYYIVVEDFTTFEILSGSLIEFYTPKSVEESTYYEIGNTYDIISGSGLVRYHQGSLQDQSGTVPAIITNTGGDTYWRRRNFVVDDGSAFQYVVENSTPSDEYIEESSDFGRVSPSLGSGGRKYLWWSIRLSDTYIPGSGTNGMCSFRSQELQNVNQDFGSIVRMIMVGGVMFVVCELKSQPIYVSKESLVDLSGATLVGRTDRILNIANETVADLGSRHPLSVFHIDGRVYGFDSVRGIPWQYAQNGQQPINTGMVQHYRYIGSRVEDNLDASRVVSGFNDQFKEWNLCWVLRAKDGSLEESDHRVYSQSVGRFSNRKNWAPEGFMLLGQRTIHFLEGKPWLADSNETRGSFFGVESGSEITIAASPEGNAVARYRSMRVSGDLWVCPDIKTYSSSTNAFMTSRLKSGRFIKRNNQHYADFLRNSSDPNHDQPLFNGEVLRGEYIVITLSPDDPTALAYLRAVDIEFDIAFDTMV
jgi:hypothetical protein